MGIARRNIYIDLFRSISVFLVVLFHYTYRYTTLFPDERNWGLVFPHGSYAVLSFFLLSGYFAVNNYEKMNAMEYGIKRFFRLFPSYWFSIIIVFPLTTLFLPSRAVGIRDFLLNFTMCQTLFGAEHVDGAYWTLLCELFFYIVIFLLCLIHKKRALPYVIITYSLSLVFLNIIPSSGTIIVLRKINDMLYLYCFMVGAIISLIEQKYVKSKVIVNLLIGSAVLLLLQQFISHDVLSGLYMMISTAVLVLCIITWKRKPIIMGNPITKIIRFIASVSYPVYLIHQNIGYMIMQYEESLGCKSEFIIVLPVLCVFVLAWIVHCLVERPGELIGKRIIQNFVHY